MPLHQSVNVFSKIKTFDGRNTVEINAQPINQRLPVLQQSGHLFGVTSIILPREALSRLSHVGIVCRLVYEQAIKDPQTRKKRKKRSEMGLRRMRLREEEEEEEEEEKEEEDAAAVGQIK